MYGSIPRRAKAAIVASLKKPASSAAAVGVPTAGGIASTVGTAPPWSLGWFDRVWPTIKRLPCSTAAWTLSCWSKPSLALFFMMRESGSVKLYWSLGRGPGVGGVGG